MLVCVPVNCSMEYGMTLDEWKYSLHADTRVTSYGIIFVFTNRMIFDYFQ